MMPSRSSARYCVPVLFLAGAVVGMVWLVSVVWAQKPSEHSTASGTQPQRGTVRQFVARYCTDCHNADEKKGGLDLGALSSEDVSARPDAWERVVRKLAARQMPPPGKKRPDERTYASFVAGLESELDAAAAKRPDPGRTPTLRRLNRTEYQNAVRDLLALEVDATLLLPADEANHGFDSAPLGDLSPTLLDRYISAAQKISLWAMAITALLGAAAHLLESVLRGRGRPGRWAWATALLGAIALQAWALLVENRQPVALPALGLSEVAAQVALSDWLNVMTVQMPSVPERVDTYVGALWLMASLVLVVGLIGGFCRLNRRARTWPRHKVAGHDVLISDNFGPALLGVRSPRIVLPRSLLDQGHEAVALVCMHEAKHREARDTWLLAAAAFTVAILPWNAALWWQLMRLRAAIELDCDNRVVADQRLRDDESIERISVV